MAKRHKHQKTMMSHVGKLITPLAFIAAFVPQLTSKDTVNNPTYSSLKATEKAKFLANSITGRMFGYNPYPQYGTRSITINPSGMFNIYSFGGLAAIVASSMMPKSLGGRANLRRVGKGLFWGGVIGGLFDDPANPNQLRTSMRSDPAQTENFDRQVFEPVESIEGGFGRAAAI